ncbi:regulatory subunit of protein kinase a-like protein, putative [Trypanosoma cruzi marinkellei]|uniref:Regulatory subunit of protein kinase a-like protein, putative n=1 Tax=Trypanosoma cruzi marinkellei TaxID=85056 RepID=K2N245_TRYCR|nr:regulatory subunit of protein kinase a-like protein, putative [Trypanosoma cruzi marinkellei]
MSKFDKCVCEWIFSASIDRQSKHQILENVITTIDEYKKMEGKGLNTQQEYKKKLTSGAFGISSRGHPRGKKDKGSVIDYKFSQEVNEVIQRLDDPQITPLPTNLSQQEENGSEDANVPLNSAVPVNPPENEASQPSADGFQENHEINDGVESEEQLTIQSDQVETDEKYEENEMEAMRYGFETFKFVKTGSRATSTSSSDAGDGGNAAAAIRYGTDEIMDDNEDERRRRITMKGHSRLGISAHSISAEEMMSTEFPTTAKSSETANFIMKVLEKHFLFSFLDDKELHKLAMVMHTEDFSEGVKVLLKGEANSKFYIILDGNATITMFEDDPDRMAKESLQKGSVFGELGLLYETQSEVSVESTSSLFCATLERNTYKIVVSRAEEEKRQRYFSFLENAPFIKDLSAQERLKIAEALKEDKYTEGDKIIRYGEKVDWLHIIVEGTADVIGRNEEGEEEYVVTKSAGECVGDLEFLYHHETVADVVATSPFVRTAKMSRLHFEQLIGTAKELLDREVKEDASYKYYRRTMVGTSAPREDLAPSFDAPPGYLSKLNVPLKL